MRSAEFAELTGFVAVAERGNFTKKAAALGVSTSHLSQTVRSLEERLGVRLLNRTTRSVALTEAGQQLLAQVQPALDDLGNAVESINAFRDTPTGILRLSVTSLAARLVVEPILPAFRSAYPDITVDVAIDDSSDDIVDGHFDAGIRSGSLIGRDMIAMRVSPDSRFIAFASPAYLAGHPLPMTPHELRSHHCIRLRRNTGAIEPWEFENGDSKVEIAVGGSLIANDLDLVVRAVREGLGIGYMLEQYIAADIEERRLVPLIAGWSCPHLGFRLFYPSRRQVPTKLKAFADFVRGGKMHRMVQPSLIVVDGIGPGAGMRLPDDRGQAAIGLYARGLAKSVTAA